MIPHVTRETILNYEGTVNAQTMKIAENVQNSIQGGAYLSCLVGGECALSGLFPLGAGLELGQVPMVIPLHFEVEDLGIAGGSSGDEPRVEQLEDPVADPGELRLDLRSVTLDGDDVVLIPPRLLLLLYGGDNPPRRPPRADDVFVGHREQIPLLHGELLVFRQRGGDLLHEIHHFLVPLGLLGQLGHVDVLLARRRRRLRRHGELLMWGCVQRERGEKTKAMWEGREGGRGGNYKVVGGRERK